MDLWGRTGVFTPRASRRCHGEERCSGLASRPVKLWPKTVRDAERWRCTVMLRVLAAHPRPHQRRRLSRMEQEGRSAERNGGKPA